MLSLNFAANLGYLTKNESATKPLTLQYIHFLFLEQVAKVRPRLNLRPLISIHVAMIRDMLDIWVSYQHLLRPALN
jgi:hypothetical protein